MLTTLKLALATAIAATGGYALQGALDVPASAPAHGKLSLASAGDSPLNAQDPLSKKVSVRIDGTVADVAKWLTDQGISFVITEQNLSQKRVMVNVVDQPLRVALDALSEALGGTWQKKGDVYVFRGRDTDDSFRYERYDPKAAPDAKGKIEVFPRIDGRTFEFRMPDLKWDDLQDTTGRKLSEAERKQMEQALKKAEEAMKKAHESMRKALEEARKSGKTRVFLGEPEVFKAKPFTDAEKAKIKDFSASGMGRLLKSLSPAQKELHKKQGYLTPKDLTAEQRKMLPAMQGDWNITVIVDGEKLSLRSSK